MWLVASCEHYFVKMSFSPLSQINILKVSVMQHCVGLPVVKVTFAGKTQYSGISSQESLQCIWTEPDCVGNRLSGLLPGPGPGG